MKYDMYLLGLVISLIMSMGGIHVVWIAREIYSGKVLKLGKHVLEEHRASLRHWECRWNDTCTPSLSFPLHGQCYQMMEVGWVNTCPPSHSCSMACTCSINWWKLGGSLVCSLLDLTPWMHWDLRRDTDTGAMSWILRQRLLKPDLCMLWI